MVMSTPPNHLSPSALQISLREAFVDRLRFARSKNPSTATNYDRFMALSLQVRDQLVERWIETQRTYYEQGVKRAYYLSAEYLLGRALRSNLVALGVYGEFEKMLSDIGIDLNELLEHEPDAGLGNGGLGRLAACFLESLATLSLPALGYGIRYEFGIFEQAIRGGYQVERADEWLKFGNPWEFARPEYTVPVGFGGQTMHVPDERNGGFKVLWKPATKVVGVPYDTPIAGYASNTVNTMRLWAARADQEFDFQLFNAGDYLKAVEDKNASEVISKVLYPNDSFEQGRELRLKQEYFFVACSIHDIVWRYTKQHKGFTNFSDHVAIQLNDTHPAIAIAELMRVLVDEHGVEWTEAWRETVATLGYTNHTLLPEALERWPVALFARLLPRHLEIIQEVNRRFLREVMAAFPHDHERIARMSIVSEAGEVRMAHLAVVGSHSVNGVAQLHTDLIKQDLLSDFFELYPERFNNKTNGVTPRRWLLECNPALAKLITDSLGTDAWPKDLDLLRGLEPHAEDAEFRTLLRTIKMENKLELSRLMFSLTKLRVDPQSIFDVQIKRLHEYKRQHLAALYAVALYLRAKRGDDIHPRTFIFGAKAAPGYRRAKLIIKLIHSIAEVINADKRQSAVRVVFLPNYRVSLAERIIPAADLSEQISTAGMEASGTGNMKLAMNGALTVGTLDGANIEIREAVGEENFFLFGLTAAEVEERRRARLMGRRALETHPLLAEALELVNEGFFCPEEPDIFKPLVDDLLGFDQYMVLTDFAAYEKVQADVDRAFRHKDEWTRKAAYNVARMGRFSSDRTINEYAREIWQIEPCTVATPRDPSLVPDAQPDMS